ncbi:MAG: hypothetical protein GEU78_09540 [Actinobacteria bacterium]|nr:hypothetical protein [Actinomycetota bacterium]
MPWVNLDDKMPDHPKITGLSDAAFRLNVSAICYCNRHLTDGLIDADEVPRLVRRFRRSAVNELVTRGVWLHHEVLHCYEVHDYLQWNKSRVQVEEAAERQRKRARKRWDK